jgi:hypothetical protein
MEREPWPLLSRHLRQAAIGSSQKYVQLQP